MTQLMRTRSQNIAEVTAYEANRMWEMKSVSGPPPMAERGWIRRGDLIFKDRCGRSRRSSPVLVGRQLTKDFACLKRMMETGEL